MVRQAILTIIIGTVFMQAELFSQQGSSSAVMTIQAEIVPATQMYATINNEVGRQIGTQSDGKDHNMELQIGEFSIVVPEGVEYTASFQSVIEMSDGRQKWSMDTKSEEIRGDGEGSTYRISGTSDRHIEPGSYKGTQIATIEYH